MPHCAHCVLWRAADAAAPGCTLLDIAFAWSVSPQYIVCPGLSGGGEGGGGVRDARACELKQEQERVLHSTPMATLAEPHCHPRGFTQGDAAVQRWLHRRRAILAQRRLSRARAAPLYLISKTWRCQALANWGSPDASCSSGRASGCPKSRPASAALKGAARGPARGAAAPPPRARSGERRQAAERAGPKVSTSFKSDQTRLKCTHTSM